MARNGAGGVVARSVVAGLSYQPGRTRHTGMGHHVLVGRAQHRFAIGVARFGVVPFGVGFSGRAIEACTVGHVLVDEAQGFVDADAPFTGSARKL